MQLDQALSRGDVDAAGLILEQNRGSIDSIGDPSFTTDSAIAMLQQDPDRLRQMARGTAMASLGTEKYLSATQPQQTEPMTQYQKETIRQKDADIEIKKSELENKKLAAQLKRETDTLKRETGALKKQEIEAKMAANNKKLETEKTEKIQTAKDSYLSAMDTIQLISDIESHSGFSDYVGAKGISSGFGLFDDPVGGTEAAGVAGMVDTLSSQSFLNSVSQMKGMGALSNSEGKKLASSMSSLDPSMPEADFKKSLSVIRNITNRGINKAKRIMKSQGVDITDNSADAGVKKVNWSDL